MGAPKKIHTDIVGDFDRCISGRDAEVRKRDIFKPKVELSKETGNMLALRLINSYRDSIHARIASHLKKKK